MRSVFKQFKWTLWILLAGLMMGSSLLISSCGLGTTPVSATSGNSNTSTPTFTFTYTPTPVVTSVSSMPSGYLYTLSNKIYISNGSTGSEWMARGVNVDDILLSGYNYGLGTYGSSSPITVEQTVSTVITGWKANFIRISLAMNSNYYTSPISWTGNTLSYATYMTSVINYITSTYPNVVVLLTLRSDSSMTENTSASDPEATGLQTASTYPVYEALVDAFGSKKNIIFGLSNEPGGSGAGSFTNAAISSAMNLGVSVIRYEENLDGYQKHLVSVQGNSYTSDLSYYASTPVTFTNVVYELHYYPQNGVASTAYSSYYGTIPLIVGEYGLFNASGSGSQSSFITDMETDHIPSLAWDLEPFNNVGPDLLNVNYSATSFSPTTWGTSVENYLLNP